MRKGGTLTYLHGDHPSAKLRTSLGSTVLETSSTGASTADQKYFAYGKQRDAGPVVTDHKFTGQKLDGTGLMYYQARYYDPVIGAFISPDTIVPDPSNLFAYNRYMYVVGNPLMYNDPTGHVTNKPEDHPDHQPYWGDLPDGMTTAELHQWISENNIPTTIGGQAGLDLSARFFVGTSASFEVGWMFNWYSGELVLDGVTSGGGVLGVGGDLTFGVHAGLTSVAGASSIERSIEGYSTYASNAISAEALVNAGGNTVIQQGVNGDKNSSFVTLGDLSKPYIDPLFDRTVDSWSGNLTVALDPSPSLVDVEVGRGIAKTTVFASTNVYGPIQSLYQRMFGE